MAIVAQETFDDFIKNRSTYITWANLANGDTGEPLSFAGHADKTMQVFGTFGAGGSITFEGSNDPRVISDPNNAVWFTMNDPQTLPLVKTGAGGDLIIENPRFMRPRITGGDVTTSITAILCCKSVL
jgi:hypothetical protein